MGVSERKTECEAKGNGKKKKRKNSRGEKNLCRPNIEGKAGKRGGVKEREMKVGSERERERETECEAKVNGKKKEK